MAQAKAGDRVQFNFVGKLDDGIVFDTTYEGAECEDEECIESGCADSGDDCGCGPEVGPMELEIGGEEFFPQIEEALIGMEAGEKKSITLKAADACGEYDEELVFSVERKKFFGDDTPTVGDNLELVGENEESSVVTVIAVEAEEVTLDANHPLAGEDLFFDLELVAIL